MSAGLAGSALLASTLALVASALGAIRGGGGGGAAGTSLSNYEVIRPAHMYEHDYHYSSPYRSASYFLPVSKTTETTE